MRDYGPMAESQLAELRNMRVLLEEARVFTRHLAYHRRARLEEVLGRALEEVDRHIEELRSEGGAPEREDSDRSPVGKPTRRENHAAAAASEGVHERLGVSNLHGGRRAPYWLAFLPSP